MSNFLNFAGNQGTTFKNHGTGGGTSFTLDVSASTNSVLLAVGGVLQEPGVDYTVSGTTITTTTSVTSGIEVFSWVLHKQGTAPVIQDNSVTGGKIALTSQAEGDIMYCNSSGDWVRLAKGTAGQVLAQNSGLTAPEWIDGATDVVLLRNEQTSGTAAGGTSTGSWGTVPLNTETLDTGAHCSLSSNQFTLTAGDYEVYAVSPFNESGIVQIKIYNTTGTADVLIGGNARAGVGGTPAMASAVIVGRFTIAGSQALELQYRCTAARASDGLGIAHSFGTEVYAQVFLRKVG